MNEEQVDELHAAPEQTVEAAGGGCSTATRPTK
jgi:hypothetical protein